MSDMERRVEALEEQVAALTEALRTSLDWEVVSGSVRASERMNFSARIAGQEATKEILDRL